MKPYFERGGVTIYLGDCREILPNGFDAVDVVVTDPPYGETSLGWDVRVGGWLQSIVAPQLWCFGSLKFFMAGAAANHTSPGVSNPFAGWRHVQEIIWEKHNGSSFHADRFKRVHEIVAHFVRDGVAWADVYKSPVFTADATARTLRRKQRPPHTGHIEAGSYTSEDGGPRMMRSVQRVRSCHGHAEHPTQKPLGIIRPLIEYSCPPGGCVLDPFMGSGSTLVAAKELGRTAVGIEIEERYCEVAANRLNQEVLAFGGMS